ncbi:MAG: pyridoxal-phosphate dependent enzyme [Bacteroidia bacterium]|nr:pyridoxal-phosphate dependent enzyme [Winogradskyella sp.]MBT8375476.1 pyridoxal-phosphate dependent enzyme [Bacteroidia bacterium]NNF85721.1 1-aminocyclopropane-1-carboxylate deaminase/D-cysteine desulfhydrase [Winogradskyella sp.]NNL83069.1 1-aminocyclopropane-1-carboxylate deaminase/D-cysteine desulfhydrase [Winogradskyella sp.]
MNTKVPTQEIDIKNRFGIKLFIKRDDLIHPHISGNKFRKLKYNLIEAREAGHKVLLSFGGAYSNHIAALSYSGKINGFKTIGIIRGDELSSEISTNATLQFAQSNGMKLVFVSREDYRRKSDPDILNKLRNELGDFYVIPEGGTNSLAVKGCEEILNSEDLNYDYICCSVGTGGTISGLINSAQVHQKIIGFPALKGSFLTKEIRKFAQRNNWELITDYHFGGYAKINQELISFINNFRDVHNIPLDPIYTGKMMYGVVDLIRNGYFEENSKIMAVHTGGLQGIAGMNKKLVKKNLPLIDV